MSHISKTLSIGQEIYIKVSDSADTKEIQRRLFVHGIRLKVLSQPKTDSIRIGVTAPSGVTPLKQRAATDTAPHQISLLVHTFSINDEMTIKLKEGTEQSKEKKWLEDGYLAFRITSIKKNQCSIATSISDDFIAFYNNNLETNKN